MKMCRYPFAHFKLKCDTEHIRERVLFSCEYHLSDEDERKT